MSAANPPELWLIAGPNGAGKTTLVQSLPRHFPLIARLFSTVCFLNPDARTLELLKHFGIDSFAQAPLADLREFFIQAANETWDELDGILDQGGRGGIETVLSSGKFRPLVEKTLAAGGRFYLIYVSLNSPELAARRVWERAASGGHDVPAEKVAARWKKSLEELPWFLARASQAWVFDNSSSTPTLLAVCRQGKARPLAPLFPELAKALSEC